MDKHLTLTGPDAGLPICGAPRSDKDAGSIHAMFYYPETHGRDFCAACLDVYEDALEAQVSAGSAL